jgi:hypothetical protein
MNDRVQKDQSRNIKGQDYEMQQLIAMPHIATSKED